MKTIKLGPVVIGVVCLVGCDPAAIVTTTIRPSGLGPTHEMVQRTFPGQGKEEALALIDSIVTAHGFQVSKMHSSESPDLGNKLKVYVASYEVRQTGWLPGPKRTSKVWCAVYWHEEKQMLTVVLSEFPASSVSDLAKRTQRDLEEQLVNRFGRDNVETTVEAVLD